MTSLSPDRLRELLDPVVESLGVELDDVVVNKAGRRSSIVVVIDKDSGIDMDTVAQVSSRIAAALETAEVVAGHPYVLEVTSPGVNRPLTTGRHWSRAVGRLVNVTLTDGPVFVARVRSVVDSSAELDVEGTLRLVNFADIARAVVQIEFTRAKGG